MSRGFDVLASELAAEGIALAEVPFSEVGGPDAAERLPALLKRRLEKDAGDLALRRALSSLPGCEGVSFERRSGEPPRVIGGEVQVALSLTHGRRRAVAAAGRVEGLGVDLCDWDEAPRLERLAPRFLTRERSLAGTPRELCWVWAAKEAGLKALGLGLFDGGAISASGGRVHLVSLAPPRLEPQELLLALGECPDGALALAWKR